MKLELLACVAFCMAMPLQAQIKHERKSLLDSDPTVVYLDDVVTAVEESENRQGGDAKIIVPPLVFHW